MLDKIRQFFGSQSASSEDSIRKVVPEEPWPDPPEAEAPKAVSMVFVDATIEISPDISIQDFFDTIEADIDRKFAVDKSHARINPHESGKLYLSARFWGFPDADYSDLSLLCAIRLDCKLINAIFEFHNRIPIPENGMTWFNLCTDEQDKYRRFHRGVEALDALRKEQQTVE